MGRTEGGGAAGRGGSDAVATVDAHHHFWDPAVGDYPWLTEELAPIRRRFAPEDLEPDLDAAGIQRSILVQTRSSLEETRDLLATAAQTGFVAGVVGWADLGDQAIEDQLAAIRRWPGGDHLVGIRHQVHDEPDPGWLLRPEVQRGIGAVGAAGLVYDLLVRPRELAPAFRTAAQNPEVRFVVDHLAKPQIAAGRLDPDWETGLARLATLPNVSCKLSGLVTEADWARWQPADLAPYVNRALDWFGPERCLFGSDWPVCLLAASYGRVHDTLRTLLARLDRVQRDRVFGGTAAEVYRLG